MMERSKQTEGANGNKKKRSRSSTISKTDGASAPDFFLSPSVAHTVGFGITGPPPQYSRVQVKSFAQVCGIIDREIRTRLALCTLDFSDIDLEYVLTVHISHFPFSL